MDPEQLKAFIGELGEALRSDMAEHCKKLDAKYDAIADAVAKMKKGDVEA
jgi:hypothetical protein